MSILRDIPRTAVDTWLKLVRVPVDLGVDRLPGNGTGAKPTAKLAVDRADLMIRGVIARILRDPVLYEDAVRRQEAADKRAEAQDLRAAAERRSEEADARLQERDRGATRLRRQADQQAEAKAEEADRKREEKAEQAAEAEAARLQASRTAAQRVEEAVDAEEPKARLDVLDAKDEAMREKEHELVARDEAGRLADAADRAKAERKS
ncbi:MAG: hypothetical protein ACJ780_14235 [Solirubrobacteraceae bacterium]